MLRNQPRDGRAIFHASYFLWLLLALPWAVIVFRYVSGDTYYGSFIHQSGRCAVWLLLFTLALTPLRQTFPRAAWPRWLLQNRRYFGVAVFAYAVPHLAAYLVKAETITRVLEDGADFSFWSGWLAMAIFLGLALTSNDWCVRHLRRQWKNLHRLVYPAAFLTCAHWIFTAFDPFLAYVHLAILCALILYRLALAMTPRRVPV